MKRFLLIFIICMFLLSGCVTQYIVDEVNLLTGIGYDNVGETVRVTALSPIYEQDRKITNVTTSVEGKLDENTIKKLNTQTTLHIVPGTLEIIIIEDQLAKEGIIPLIDVVRRHPVIGSRVYLMVAEGKSKDILEADLEFGTGRGIVNLIEQNMTMGPLPKTNLHIFRSDYHERGFDPVLPLVKRSGDKVFLEGLALFDQDKFVGAIKDNQETFVFKNLLENDDKLRDTFAFKIEETGDFVRLEESSSNRRYEVKDGKTNPKINIKLKIMASVTDYPPGEITKSMKKKIENSMKKEIEEIAHRMIKRFQEQHIDPLGIGMQVRSRTRGWDEKEWDKQYPDADIKVTAEVEIINYGIFE